MARYLIVTAVLLGLATFVVLYPGKQKEIALTPQIQVEAEPIVPQKPVKPKRKIPKKQTQHDLLIEAHNKIRQSNRLQPLARDEQLCQIAQKWAEHMATTHIMRHQALRFGEGWHGMGENIAEGQRSIDEVMSAWMHSPGHKRNILGNYTHIGVGIATSKNGTIFWCVDFGKKGYRNRFWNWLSKLL